MTGERLRRETHLDRGAGAVLGAVLLAVASGCGGSAPLLHPAHVLRPGFVEVGAGVSGQVSLDTGAISPAAAPLEDLTVAPGVAPWASGRVGIRGDNEAGITFTGRALRVDGRHAFGLGPVALSVGAGASAVIARQPGHGLDASSVYGGGLDVPVLLGIRTRGDLYALWIGPRVGVELLQGQLAAENPGPNEDLFSDVKATHWFVGGVVGLRAGFRHIHAAVEAGFSFHRADGQLGGTSLALQQLALTPGGAVLVGF